MRKTATIVSFGVLVYMLTISGCKNEASKQAVDPVIVSAAEKLFDLKMSSSEKDSMIDALETQLADYKIIHSQLIDNSVPPAIWFNPVPAGVVYKTEQNPINWNLPASVSMPGDINELAWLHPQNSQNYSWAG